MLFVLVLPIAVLVMIIIKLLQYSISIMITIKSGLIGCSQGLVKYEKIVRLRSFHSVN